MHARQLMAWLMWLQGRGCRRASGYSLADVHIVALREQHVTAPLLRGPISQDVSRVACGTTMALDSKRSTQARRAFHNTSAHLLGNAQAACIACVASCCCAHRRRGTCSTKEWCGAAPRALLSTAAGRCAPCQCALHTCCLADTTPPSCAGRCRGVSKICVTDPHLQHNDCITQIYRLAAA